MVAALAGPLRLPRWRAVGVSGLVNLATQPALVLALRRLPAAGGERWWIVVGAAELAVVLVEAAVYRLLVTGGRRNAAANALALSFAANAASTLVGLALPL